VAHLKVERRQPIFAPLDETLLLKVPVAKVQNPDLFTESHRNLFPWHVYMKVLIILLIVALVLLVARKSSYRCGRGKIVCSMTTIPPRYDIIQKTLDSLQRQTISPDVIYINVAPETMKSHPQDIPRLEGIAKKYPNVRVNVIEKDLGPITKIVPIEKFVSTGDFVILVDDDVVYQPTMIEGLVNSGLPVAGYAGRTKDLTFIAGDSLQKNARVDFLEAYAGVMYDGGIIQGLGDHNDSLGQTCITQDDIKIGQFLANKGTKLFVVPTKDFAKHDAHGTPELNKENLSHINASCVKELMSA